MKIDIDIKAASTEETKTAFILTSELMEYHNVIDIFTITYRRFRGLVENRVVMSYGNTAQRLCGRCAVKFFARLHKNFAGRVRVAGGNLCEAVAPTEPTGETLPPVKRFLCDMTENLQAYDVQSRQAVFVRCCPIFHISQTKRQG